MHIANLSFAGILVDNGDRLVVDHCLTSDTASSGIAFFGGHDVLVDANEAVHAGSGGNQEHISIAVVDGFDARYNNLS